MDNWQEKRAILMKSPMFQHLRQTEIDSLESIFKEKTFNKGDTICHEGEIGDSCYIVLSGELEIWISHNIEAPVNRLGTGEIVGEMALLLGDKRTATVKASQATELLEISQDAFEKLRSNTKVLEYFSRLLCTRLTATTHRQTTQKTIDVISVISLPDLKGKTMVAKALARLLYAETREEVLLVNVKHKKRASDNNTDSLVKNFIDAPGEEIRSQIRSGLSNTAELDVQMPSDLTSDKHSQKIGDFVAKLSDYFSYIIFDFDDGPKPLINSVSSFSDYLIKLVDNAEILRCQHNEENKDKIPTFRVLNLANQNTRKIPINSCDPFVIPEDNLLASLELDVKPYSPGIRTLQRLTRKVLGTTIGLALGGGAAFGISHLGVLQVLENYDIPIDLIAGCSIGSMVASGYAANVPLKKLIQMAEVLGGSKANLLQLVDLGILTKPGFIGGDKIMDVFGPYLGSCQDFEDLIIPCQVCATDIENGELVNIKEGLLKHAFRASSAVPVALAPYVHNGKVLVDGGVCEPVPINTIQNMGADIVIAINVVPPLNSGTEMDISGWFRQINMFNPLAVFNGGAHLPNLMDITMNSLQTLQHELGTLKAQHADIAITPELSEFTWLDFDHHEELIQAGVEATERQLKNIQNILENKVPKFSPNKKN